MRKGARSTWWIGAISACLGLSCVGLDPAASTDVDLGRADGFGPESGDGPLEGYGTSDFFLGAIRTGSMPKGAEVSPDGQWVLTSNFAQPTVTAVDLEALAEWRRAHPDAWFSSDSRTTSSLERWLGLLGVPDDQVDERLETLDAGEIVTTIATPFGYQGAVTGNVEIAFVEGTTWALVTQLERQALRGIGQVTVIDTTTLEVVAEIPTEGRGSKVIAVAPTVDAEGRRVVYVANWFSNDISVIRIDEELLRREVEAYVPGRLSRDLHVRQIRLVTSNPHRTDPFPIAPRGVAFTHDGRYALVAGFNSRTLIIVDAQRHVQVAEVAPVPPEIGASALRHIVMSEDGRTAYVSLMSSDVVLAIDVAALIERVEAARGAEPPSYVTAVLESRDGEDVPVLGTSVWHDVLLYSVDVDLYSQEHTRPASLRGRTTSAADPNTIVLDPRPGNRYLYVSCRTTKGYPPRDGVYDWDGKIDVVDTRTGRVIFSLVGGEEPMGLTITPDGRTLISSDFRGSRVRFYDVGLLTDIYEAALDGREGD